MVAVIEIGGKQYRVSPNQVFYSELTGKENGEEFSIEKVLLLEDEENIKIGQPFLSDVNVKAKVMEEVKGPKITGFIYKKRKNYHKKWGHRQKYQKLQITTMQSK